jgi:ABC-type Fe2+-enterobactin transport system substrate-binding protein
VSEHEELRAMVQTSVGNYYQHLLQYLVQRFMEKEGVEASAQKKTVEFDLADVKWPVIKPLLQKNDAVEVFKLGNT